MPKNSCFSMNEKRLPLFWSWETGFTFHFSNSFPYLKRVHKWSCLSTCFSELVSTFRRSNEISRHFEVSFFRSENVSATAVSTFDIHSEFLYKGNVYDTAKNTLHSFHPVRKGILPASVMPGLGNNKLARCKGCIAFVQSPKVSVVAIASSYNA